MLLIGQSPQAIHVAIAAKENQSSPWRADLVNSGGSMSAGVKGLHVWSGGIRCELMRAL
jgi:hypothetical protein